MDEIKKAIEKMRESGQEPKGIWCGADAFNYLKTKDEFLCGNPCKIYGLPVELKPEFPSDEFCVVSRTYSDAMRSIKKTKPKGKTIQLPKWRKKEKEPWE